MATTSILSSNQEAYINSLHDKVFETFKRQIEIVTEGTSIVVQTNPTGYNPSYPKKNTKVTTTQVKTLFDAVVEYSPTVTDQLLQQVPDIKAKQARGVVRVSVKEDGREVLKKAKDIQFDGHSYDVETSDIPRMMFGTATYYDFWLIRKN